VRRWRDHPERRNTHLSGADLTAERLRSFVEGLDAKAAPQSSPQTGAAPSGWEWRLRFREACIELQRRGADDEDGRVWTREAYLANNDWRRAVPPCDHEHVAALIERECVR
jgi:hypothetical protein